MFNKNSDIMAFASDHAGYDLKNKLIDMLTNEGYKILDLGTNSADISVDYPDFGFAMGEAIAKGNAKFGVVICGSGIGISIAANRFANVIAALCLNEEMAKLAREHNNANVIALGARMIDIKTAKSCIEKFFTTKFASGRHKKRVEKLKSKGQAI